MSPRCYSNCLQVSDSPASQQEGERSLDDEAQTGIRRQVAANHASPSQGLGVCKLSPFLGSTVWNTVGARMVACPGVDFPCLIWISRASKVTLQDIIAHVDGDGARKAEGLEFFVEVEERASTMRGALLQLVEALNKDAFRAGAVSCGPDRAQKVTVAGVKAVAQD